MSEASSFLVIYNMYIVLVQCHTISIYSETLSCVEHYTIDNRGYVSGIGNG